jgi:acyl-CoA thioesterase
MTKRLLDFDPNTGVHTYHQYDEAEDKTYVSYEQDVEQILERNKRLANDATGPMGDMCHVATIPTTVQLKWLIEYGVDLTNKDHMPRVKRLLNSDEWRYLKVRHIII